MDSPYTVEFTHSASVYMSIPAAQRNGSQTQHYLPPGQYEIVASYQGAEVLTVQFQSTVQPSGNIIHTPTGGHGLSTQVADPRTVIVQDGTTAYLRCFTTPRTSDLTDKTGIGSLMIIPIPRYGDE